MIEIIPAIIPKDYNLLKERLEKVVGLTKRVQIDIVDGKYAPTVTWPFSNEQRDHLLQMVRNEEKLPFSEELVIEIDMLVLHPIEYIPDMLSLGARSFVIHIDSTDHVSECIEAIKLAGCEVGVALRPSVDESLLHPYIMDVNFVQFMGNDRVGYNGVDLDPTVLEKIAKFHSEHPTVEIQIDIGVSLETIPSLKAAGVSRFISGSAIFTAPDIAKVIEEMRNS